MIVFGLALLFAVDAATDYTLEHAMERGSYIWIQRIRLVPSVAFSGICGSMLFLAILITGGSSLADGAQRGPKPQKHQPAWRVDLRALGYEDRQILRETVAEDTLNRPKPLWFGESGVVVTFVKRHPVETLARGDPSSSPRPLRLHALVLDGATGEMKASLERSIPSATASVIAIYQGKVVVRTRDRLTLYSPQFEQLKEFDLKWFNQHPVEKWNHVVSPTGKSILLEHNRPPEEDFRELIEGSYKWIDVETLESLYEWKDLLAIPDFRSWPSISDTSIAIWREIPPTFSREVWLRELAGNWRRISGPCPPPKCGSPHFVNNETLVVLGLHGLKLIQSDGAVVYVEQFHRKDWLHQFHIAVAAGGQRFVVALAEKKGGSALFDIMPRFPLTRIMVFDIPSQRWIYTLDAKRLKLKRFDGIALSPDGSLLGILRDGIVEVYRISDSKATPE